MCAPKSFVNMNFCNLLRKLLVRLLMGVLPSIVAVDEVLLRTGSHQTKGTKKVISEETTNIAPANKRNETTQTNSYTQRHLQFITNDRTPSIAPVFQRSLNPSTVANVSFTRPSSKFFFERMLSGGAVISFYCPSVETKRTSVISLIWVGELLFERIDWTKSHR